MTVFVKTFALVALALVINEITAIRSKTSMRTLYKGPVKPPAPGEEFDTRHWLQSAMPKREERCTGTSKEKDDGQCPHGEPLGMEDGRIPDASISASTIRQNNDDHCGPKRGRLQNKLGSHSWCPDSTDKAPWIQVDFNSQVYITGLITQGRGESNQWVTRYYVKYSDDGDSWYNLTYADRTIVEFVGNVDCCGLVTARFEATLHTRFLRILPTACFDAFRVRFEVLGCQQLD